MKAISLWQPWASFIAIGIKPFETRSWDAPRWLIGQRVAVHAAKKAVSADDREWARRHGIDDLPLGAIVCTAQLAGSYLLSSQSPQGVRAVRFGHAAIVGSLFDEFDEFGDYADGRWAWLLTDVDRFKPPIEARGAQGFWNWTP